LKINLKNTIYVLITLFILAPSLKSKADEGMWIPLLLGDINEAEMQAMGLKITAEEIYSINNSSLKDAIVIFGGGCTGEIVSEKGLLLTNHHCGYGAIQRHSSLEHNYLKDGFWAMNQDEELACAGLTATMLKRMEEVTDKVLLGVRDEMTEEERKQLISNNIGLLEEEASEKGRYKIRVVPFFYGNQYYMMVSEVFKDVRLVGAPPSNIGKFGGDTDNWMWPRHTGDFSIFRIYVNADNKPAAYSEDNVPYKPKKALDVSIKGTEVDDFTFVFGYPGRTQEYLPSYAIEQITEVTNPIRIDMRGKALDIINAAMNQDELVRIQYSSKQSGIANGWKKWIGENKGIKKLDGIEKKETFQEEFTNWVIASNERNDDYGQLLDNFKSIYDEAAPLEVAYVYLSETGRMIDALRTASRFDDLVKLSISHKEDPEGYNKQLERVRNSIPSYFKNYNQSIDKDLFITLMKITYENLDEKYFPAVFYQIRNKYKGDISAYADMVYEKSIFTSEERLISFMSSYKASKYKKILKDPIFIISADAGDVMNTMLRPPLRAFDNEISRLMRTYMKAQMEMQPDSRFYPDANFTLRVGYGKVEGYYPMDAVYYNHLTTLSGIMEKENPDIFDYVVEDKLKELYTNKDYGQYADKDGAMHVCFTASNHTTGGNSGSPVLNANGELIGINFDRCWEGTMSDLMYDPDQCRNISIDIRYLLFIIDKFAGAGHLVKEMNIVN